MNLYEFVKANEEYAHLTEEWDVDKNGCMEDYGRACGKRVEWKCSEDNHHIWPSTINNRTGKNVPGCPICRNKLICPHDQCNSLYYERPELRSEWNTEKNGSMKNYFAGSSKVVYWKCSNVSHHEWKTNINNRTGVNAGSCPICSNQIICPYDQCNSLYFAVPQLRCEWDTKKNGSMKNYSPSSGKKVYWICSTNPKHQWKAMIANRTKKEDPRGCPHCLYKSEQKCREIFQDIFDTNFKKCRPKFLDGLELDGYNKKYGLAFEYQGRQHYYYNPHYHQNDRKNLIKQQERDKLKKELCDENEIILIEIPYIYSYTKPKLLKKFIADELSEYSLV